MIFRSSANYAYFINRAELRILDRANRRKPVAVLPISSNGQAGWSMPEGGRAIMPMCCGSMMRRGGLMKPNLCD